jgi:hypothetical protein
MLVGYSAAIRFGGVKNCFHKSHEEPRRDRDILKDSHPQEKPPAGPCMVDSKVITEWVEKANEDLEFARINLNENRAFYAQICFHFQQSAEKYLKAYIMDDLDRS